MAFSISTIVLHCSFIELFISDISHTGLENAPGVRPPIIVDRKSKQLIGKIDLIY